MLTEQELHRTYMSISATMKYGDLFKEEAKERLFFAYLDYREFPQEENEELFYETCTEIGWDSIFDELCVVEPLFKRFLTYVLSSIDMKMLII